MNIKLDSVLDRELRDALSSNRDFNFLRGILMKYEERNFRPESVYGLIESMRIGVTEDIEDRVLELMDIVSGFCSPDMRVW